MKQLTLVFALLPFIVSAQLKDIEYLNRTDIPANKYPISETSYEHFFKWFLNVSTIQDPETGIFRKQDIRYKKTSEYTRKQWKTMLKNRSAYSFIRGSRLNYHSDEIPPSLDSLKDGKYVQYYSAVPIYRNDTLFASDTCIAAIFSIKNGLLHGPATWYSPMGIIKQTGDFLDGKKDGLWVVNTITEDRFTPATTINSYYELWFKNNIKNGPYNQYTKNGTLVYVELSNHLNGKLDGEYLRTVNGQTIQSGAYRNGKEIGTWELNRQTETGELIPGERYTLNTDSVLIFQPFPYDIYFPGTLLPYSNNGIDNSWTEEMDWLITGFRSWESTPNCMELGFSHKSFLDPDGAETDFIDTLGNQIPFNEIAQKCGLLLKYTGKYEEYHYNGQLHFALDLSNPTNYFNFTVYHSNGVPVRILKELSDSTYSVSQFDTLNKLLQVTTYHKKTGDELSRLFKQKTLTIDGKEYAQVYDKNYLYEDARIKFDLDLDSVLLYEKRSAKDSSLLRKSYYFPKQRKGIVESHYSSAGLKQIQEYSFDSLYKAVFQTTDFRLGNLSMRQEVSKDLEKVANIEYILPQPGDTTISKFFIDQGDLSVQSEMNTLLYNGQPFSGIVEIRYDTTITGLTFKESSKHIKITLNPLDREDLFVNYLFRDLREFLDGNNIQRDYFFDIHPDVLQKLGLHNVTLTFKNGLLNGESTFKSKRLLLASFQYKDGIKHGVQTGYNNFPRTFSNSKYYLDNYYGESRFQHFVSHKETYLDGKLNGDYIQLESKSDTSSYVYYINGKTSGKPASFYIYNSNRMYNFYEDTIKVSTKVVSLTTNRTLATWNRKNGSMKSFYFNNQVAHETQYNPEKDTTCFIYRDTNGIVTGKVYFLNHVLDYAEMYNDWGISGVLDFNNSDSLDYNSSRSYNVAIDLMDSPFFEVAKKHYPHVVATSLDYATAYTVQYNESGKIGEGMLNSGKKDGLWKYYDSGKLTSTIFYRDTFLQKQNDYMTTGTIRQFDNTGVVQYKATLYDVERDYSCFDENYVERYQLYYSIYDYKPVTGTTIQHKNLYFNGNAMNEGLLIDGMPHGLWKMYRYDGSLYKMGIYDHGNKVGRWLTGDLSKIRFMGETCLDPSTTDYQSMLKEIDVQVEYFELGRLISSDFYNYRTQ